MRTVTKCISLVIILTAIILGPHLSPPVTIAANNVRERIATGSKVPAMLPSFDYAAANQVVIFDDNLESGAPGWAAEGFWHLINNPQNIPVFHVGTPIPDDPPNDINPDLVTLPDLDVDGNAWLPLAHSGTYVFWYGVDENGTFIDDPFDLSIQTAKNGGNSTAPNEGSLTSPTIDLTAVEEASLEFWTWWEIEGVDANAFDMMYVQISVDGGEFQTLGQLNPINDVDNLPEQNYSSGGSSAPPIWINPHFDLSQFAGHEIQIRFLFQTMDSNYNGFRGWVIDDIKVVAQGISAPVITGVSPTCVPIDQIGTTIVNIHGENFATGATVTVGGIEAAQTAVIDSTKIQILLPPALGLGTYDITVTNPDGKTGTLVNAISIAETCVAECEEDDSGALDIVGKSGGVGGTVTIPVRIQSAPNDVNSLGFEVFPPSVLTFTEHTRGPLVEDFDFFDCNIPDDKPDVVRCGGFKAEGGIAAGASGDVVSLNFDVIGGEPGSSYPLSLQELVDDMASWPFSPGCFTVVACDVNGDGEVTPEDALCAFQKYLGIDPTACGPAEDIFCDVNGDGECTPADALEIFKEYLGLPSVCSEE